MGKVCMSCSAPIDEPNMAEGEDENCGNCAPAPEAAAEADAPETPSAE
ncbi:MAG: hypothetical protein O2877_02650 [bacterium]|nr:hypothetical protein [bacterium]